MICYTIHVRNRWGKRYGYEQKKDSKQALEWYEKYLAVAKPGTKGYDFAMESVKYLKGERFMEEKE